MDSTKKYDNPSPEVKTHFLSKLFFCWVLPFLKHGYKNGLQIKDIYNTTESDLSGPLGDSLEKYWNLEVERAKQGKGKPSLKRAIFKTVGKSYSIYGVYIFIQVIILRTIHPIILAEYIQYYESSTLKRNPETGWLLATSVIMITFFNTMIYHHCSIGCQRIGMRVRIACCSLIYRKLLKLNQMSVGQTAAGQLVNLLSNDVQRFDLAANFMHYIWIMPIQCVTGLYVMYRSVGVAAFAGMTVMALESIPLQGYLSKLQGKLRYKIAEKTDYRVKLMSEIVSGIQVIKMYAWEKSFEKVVELARKLEIDKITLSSYIKGLYLGFTVFTERLCLYLTLITYVLLGNRLTGDIVFSMAQLFNTVQLYMAIFYPSGLAAYAEAKVSIKRLEQFLALEEKDLDITANSDIVETEKAGTVKLTKVNATWLPDPIADTLMDISLEIKPGTLCCVVGNVGSGKTSLLQTLLKELPVTKGHLETVGNISYASQEPWLFVSSLRNNILFGQPYIKPRYQEIVKVCALDTDFKRFPYGDKTLVGERGVSLSGGQRARINLARAVYAEADIYLLDDPLSAVDTHVGKHLFVRCIQMYLKGKTRILVTHQLQFLKQADLIVIVNNGKVEKIGTYNELNENDLINLVHEQHEDKKEIIISAIDRKKSVASFASSTMTIEEPQETQELIEKGVIPASTYTEYFKNGASTPIIIFAIIFLLVAQLASNAADFWVTYWTNMEDKRYDQAKATISERSLNKQSNLQNIAPTGSALSLVLEANQTTFSPMNVAIDEDTISLFMYPIPQKEFYIIVYSIFIAASVILTPLSRNLCYLIFMRASKILHKKMFKNILQAPMRFFDTNPSGRILNRFSKDMGTIDETLPKATLEAIQVFLVMGGILLLVFVVSPWMILPAVLLGFIFYVCEVVYLTSAQDIKRLEGVTRAPVFSHISASLYGLSTIRASGAEKMIINEFDALQDQHTATWYLMITCSETFGFYLDIVSTVFLSCVTYQFLIFGDGNTMGANVGLVISQAMILTGMLQLGPRATADVASNMTSVERVLQYSKLLKEGQFESLPTKKPPHGWPHLGKITFKNTYLKYVMEDPPVLKNLNIEVEPGEKVGIVGRTGAGKSTLIASLFRLAPIDGTIAIDDIDTSSIGLYDLRSNISIIPQEPVLFSATIRYNLDPFDKATDDILWDALEKVELKGAVENLNMMVSEGGYNFSAGQRQLLCLARAIVRNNKVLVMDEATANVDQATDALIQKTIRQNFKDCTVLTIAHRLNTIMDSDKVLVMDAGEAVEFSHPHVLLQNPDGYFSKMVREVGPNMEAKLREVAKQDYEAKTNES